MTKASRKAGFGPDWLVHSIYNQLLGKGVDRDTIYPRVCATNQCPAGITYTKSDCDCPNCNTVISINCNWQNIESESPWHRLVGKDEPWSVQEAASFSLGKRRWDGRADFVAISTSSSACGGWAESEKAVSKPICWSKDWYASSYWSTPLRWQEENETFASRI